MKRKEKKTESSSINNRHGDEKSDEETEKYLKKYSRSWFWITSLSVLCLILLLSIQEILND
jgi:hypothetical protein